jgi:uncharacterized protein (DUF1800 family)
LWIVCAVFVWASYLLGPASAQQGSRKLEGSEASRHVLTRLAFGPRPREVNDVTKLGWKRWVEQQLHPEEIDDRATEQLIAEKCPTLSMSLSEVQSLDKPGNQQDRDERTRIKNELRDSVLLRAIYSERQFQEVIVDFWRNHFNVDVTKVPFLATDYEESVLRKHAFSKFEDLLLATAKHPAMLVYLDNYVSRANGLNENYARELMELHTLSVDNGYSQEDVINLARVLTGWTCGRRGDEYEFFFNDSIHDTDPATVIGLELDGTGGMADGEKAIRHLANHKNTARFIATKLCRYLVNDSPSGELIDGVTDIYLDSGGDLREVYRAVILCPEFMNPKNFRVKFRTPFEFLAATLRTTAAQIDSTSELHRELQLMGQPLYEHTEPTGYSDLRESWLDPGVMVYRWNFCIQLVQDKVKGVKIGPAFADQVLQQAQSDRVKKVMENVLTGVIDPQTQKLVASTTDIRAMVALALGSAGYQQQ